MKPKNLVNCFTIIELITAAFELAFDDAEFVNAMADANLEYRQYSSMIDVECPNLVTRCNFDCYSRTVFGSNEGVYTDIVFCGGDWDAGKDIYVFKTLDTSKDAYVAMSKIGALLAYYVTKVIRDNLDRFN